MGSAILYENIADTAVITASSWIAAAPPSTLQNPHVTRRWKGTSGATEYILASWSAPQSIDTIALLGLATIDDGVLDLIAVRDAPPLRRLWTLLAAARGKHLGMAGVEHRTAAAFTLRFETAPLFEVDGELVQSDSATISVRCERARLRVCAA